MAAADVGSGCGPAATAMAATGWVRWSGHAAHGARIRPSGAPGITTSQRRRAGVAAQRPRVAANPNLGKQAEPTTSAAARQWPPAARQSAVGSAHRF